MSTTSSRRLFLRRLGAASIVPFLPKLTFADAQAPSTRHHVLTCNIRVALPDDEAKGVGWPQRKEICLQIIKAQRPDIVGFQEVLKVQAEDIRKAFPGYTLFGFDGPEMDAHTEGYHGIAKNPILFSNERYELIAGGGYWLSETPLKAGSLSWGSARARNANWVRLRERKSGKEFRVVNLHLDHVSNEAKLQQIKLVLEESAQYQETFPQILTGDFNSRATSKVIEAVKAAGWKDTFTATEQFTGHSFEGLQYAKGKPDGRIDYIFGTSVIQAADSKVITDAVKGKYPSDHFFVSAHLNIL
ncbi:endonuclease/exonuclease/phosphatase family protein [Chitinophaga lutea]